MLAQVRPAQLTPGQLTPAQAKSVGSVASRVAGAIGRREVDGGKECLDQ